MSRVTSKVQDRVMTVAERLALFDAATERQKRRQAGWRRKWKKTDRGWTREDLYYDRGLAS